MKRGHLTAYDVAEHYDEAYFADLTARYRTRTRFARRRISNVLSLLPELGGVTLLDVGCGMGTFTVETAARGAHAVGIDPAAAAVHAAAGVAAAAGYPSARFVRGDAANLPVCDGCADVVLAADLTEHLDDVTLARVLREAARALRPGGVLVVYTPERQHFLERLREAGIMRQDPSHIGVRTAAALRAAIESAGLAVRRQEWLPSHVPMLSLAERSLGRWMPLLRRRIGIVAERAAE
jgi:SAM-dependent methyltransferase